MTVYGARTEGIAQLNKQNSLASSNLFSFSIHWREDKREKHRLFPSLPQKNDKSSSPSSLSSRVSLPPLPTSPVPPAYSSPLALLSDPLYSPISFLFPNFFPSVLGLSSLYCRFRHFSLRLRGKPLDLIRLLSILIHLLRRLNFCVLLLDCCSRCIVFASQWYVPQEVGEWKSWQGFSLLGLSLTL